jgi:hypothetical protein
MALLKSGNEQHGQSALRVEIDAGVFVLTPAGAPLARSQLSRTHVSKKFADFQLEAIAVTRQRARS